MCVSKYACESVSKLFNIVHCMSLLLLCALARKGSSLASVRIDGLC